MVVKKHRQSVQKFEGIHWRVLSVGLFFLAALVFLVGAGQFEDLADASGNTSDMWMFIVGVLIVIISLAMGALAVHIWDSVVRSKDDQPKQRHLKAKHE